MNRVMSYWIIYLQHETSKFISSARFQVIPFERNPCSTGSLKKLICRRFYVKTYELNDMTQKCLLRLKHQVKIRVPKQTAEYFIFVFLDIRSANIADHIIDADIYHEAFTYFVVYVKRIMEVFTYSS